MHDIEFSDPSYHKKTCELINHNVRQFRSSNAIRIYKAITYYIIQGNNLNATKENNVLSSILVDGEPFQRQEILVSIRNNWDGT